MKSLSLTLSSLLLLAATSCQVTPSSNAFGANAPAKKPAAPSAAEQAAKAAAEAAAAASAPVNKPVADAQGFYTTASGLRYKVLASGPQGGQSPSRNDSVTVHYRGTLASGTVFDSSYERGAPATFGVSQVIPGWTEAMQLMKPGDKWLLQVPFNLAYGAQGMPPKIPPFSELTFEVELLQVQRSPQ